MWKTLYLTIVSDLSNAAVCIFLWTNVVQGCDTCVSIIVPDLNNAEVHIFYEQMLHNAVIHVCVSFTDNNA